VAFIRRSVITELLIALALSPAHARIGLQSPKKAHPQSTSVPAPEDRVDINTASIDMLLKLPGMKRTWAARIVRSRPYRAKNELLDRGVLTSQVYDRIKDYIVARRPGQ
jgi:DNA uptake protein ComE-like DNA-binding protein